MFIIIKHNLNKYSMKFIKLATGICLTMLVFLTSLYGYDIMTPNITNNITSKDMDSIKFNNLTSEEEFVILKKGTEMPFSGELLNEKRTGTFYCRRCEAPLYLSKDKFDSGCGWPSFDDEIPGAIKRSLDADGIRTEITCARCGAHLGHVFIGEGFTNKNTRHCVNSISMIFKPDYKKAYFAAGCFWGVQYYMGKIEGVVSSSVGYMGGKTDNPTYKDVCTGDTEHLETVEVVYDPNIVDYEKLAKVFFEIHDFSQSNGQGPDIGNQYLSAVFVQNDNEEKIVKNLIEQLKKNNYKVATTIRHDSVFYRAEDYHQDYYDKKNGIPYCHSRKKIF